MKKILLVLMFLLPALAQCNPYSCTPGCTSSLPICVQDSPGNCYSSCGTNYGKACRNCYTLGNQGICTSGATCCTNWAADPNIPGNWNGNEICTSSRACPADANNYTVDLDYNGTSWDSYCCAGSATDVWNCSATDMCGAAPGPAFSIDNVCCTTKGFTWMGSIVATPKQYCCGDDIGEKNITECTGGAGNACMLSNSTCQCTTCADAYACTKDFCFTENSTVVCKGDTQSCCSHCVLENNQTTACAGGVYQCCSKGTLDQTLYKDPDNNYCIFCTNNPGFGVTQNVLDSRDLTCESDWCGADAYCDELSVGSYFHNPGRPGSRNDTYCNTSCGAYDCQPYIVYTPSLPVACANTCSSNANCTDGFNCDLIDFNNSTYSGKCALCSGAVQVKTASIAQAFVDGDYQCESGCGSAALCDEYYPATCHREGDYYSNCSSGCAATNCTSYSCTNGLGCLTSCSSYSNCNPFSPSYCLLSLSSCYLEPYAAGCGRSCDKAAGTEYLNTTGYCLSGTPGTNNLNVPTNSTCTNGDDCCTGLCIDNATVDLVPDTCSNSPVGFGYCGRSCDLYGKSGTQYLNSTGYCLNATEFSDDGNSPNGAACGVGDDCCNQTCVDTSGTLWPGDSVVDTCDNSGTRACGTLCDFNGVLGDEVIGPAGGCDGRLSNCSIGSFYFDSSSDTSSMHLFGNVTCQCSELASCTITIYNSSGNPTSYPTDSSQLSSGKTISSPPVTYGVNQVKLNCTCPATKSTCTRWAQNATIQASFIGLISTDLISPTHYWNTTISIRNTGSLGLDLNITDKVFNATQCVNDTEITKWSNLTTMYVSSSGASGDSISLTITHYADCEDVLQNYIHIAQFCETRVGCPAVLNFTTDGCFDVRECYDYGSIMIDPRADCAACGPSYLALTDYDCPDNWHCCLKGEHFENGACCPEGFTCCTANGDCADDQYCDTSLGACITKGHPGSTCLTDQMCISLHCDNSTHYCCESSVSGCQQVNGTCRCCRESNECDGGFYCDVFTNICMQCTTNDDGVCDSAPATTCVGTDPNCCATDGNCASGNYCDSLSLVCRTCSSKKDYWCPSSRCIGTDPDCCDSGHPCPFGTCNPLTHTCEILLGNYCQQNSDCASNYCQQNKCIVQNWLTVQPANLPVRFRGKSMVTLTAVNYMGEPVMVNLDIDSPVAKFANRKKTLTVSLNKGEVKQIPVIVEAGVIGTYPVTITGTDATLSDIKDTAGLMVIVRGAQTSNGIVVAPEELAWSMLGVLYAIAGWKLLG